ncbi:MAG: AAA domain-containing protein [Allomuricauda sp.]
MGYTSYLLEKFDFTHENKFFRLLDEKFRIAFNDHDNDHVFIGNISVGGHSLDAIFIKRGAIIVIDFKDYSGELTFSENGPWRITKDDGGILFVAGGAHSRNPYQQVNAYRFALFQFLSENEQTILEANHSNITWAHTNAMVLFQREVKFNQNTIPPKIQRYFHVTHFDRVIDDIEDIYSNGLNFSDAEIQNILKTLNINISNPFKSNQDDFDSDVESTTIDSSRLERIIGLIPDVEHEDTIIKALGFYNTMLSIERVNNSKVLDIHHYPINWGSVTTNKYILNLEVNTRCLNIYLQNSQQRFPKNLFFSVNLLFQELTVPLFYTIIQFADVDNQKAIEMNFDGFDLYRPVLEELNLTEDVIEELSSLVNVQYSLSDKIEAVRDYLEVPLELVDRISVGLSNESLFSAQLQSELNQWIKKKRILDNPPVFKGFVTNSKIRNESLEDNSPIIQITELNKSQKQGIALSFKQPLTVITGPPGTGKSQVVANILANATIKEQKVLFASKNNKAVDNVHQRISNLLNTNYFLRLGSNHHTDALLENLNAIIQKIRSNDFEDHSDLLKNKKLELEKIKQHKEDILNNLAQIDVLNSVIPKLQEKLQQVQNTFSDWIESVNKEEFQLYVAKNLTLNVSNSELNLLLRVVSKSKTSFLNRISFNWFKKDKTIESIEKLNHNQPPEIKSYIDGIAPVFTSKGDVVESLYSNLVCIKTQLDNQKDLTTRHEKFTKEINSLSEKIEDSKTKLSYLQENKENLKKSFQNLAEQEPLLGIEILKATINERLRKADISAIEGYKGLVQNGIPWQRNEQMECANITNAFLEIFNTISITNLTIKKGFLQESGIFDLLVIDEASQCDLPSALPLIYRAKRVVIIGDSLQLPHISSVRKHEQKFVLDRLGLPEKDFNYLKDSLFEKAKTLSNLSLLESTFLNEHYRCHPNIVGFSNQYFYLPKAGHSLNIKTNPEDFTKGTPGLNWINVNGQIEYGRNENKSEVHQCVGLAIKLMQEYPEASIGIATPFRHQKEALITALKDVKGAEKITCDVIHNFQGDEKDIVILSLVVTTNCRASLPRFINEASPYLLNVAITRAKSALYIVGNKSYCKRLRLNGQNSLLANLANYATAN